MTKQSTAQLINANSGKTVYYTPGYILDAAAETMGSMRDEYEHDWRFDLDPASSDEGNKHVGAYRYFDEEINGLNQDWIADSVWLNHPYSRKWNQEWIHKAVSEYINSNARQICMITWASTSEKWIHPLFNYPMCFLKRRVKFIDPGRLLTGATKSSVVTYMGQNVTAFVENFSPLGHIMFPTAFIQYMAHKPRRLEQPGNHLLVHDNA